MHWTRDGSRKIFRIRVVRDVQGIQVVPRLRVLETAATNSRALVRRRYRNAPRRGSSVSGRQQGQERRGETGEDLPSRGRPARLVCRSGAECGAAVREVGEPLLTEMLDAVTR